MCRQTGSCVYLFFLKFVVDKSKNETPNNKYGIAGIVFLSTPSIRFFIVFCSRSSRNMPAYPDTSACQYDS